MRLLTGGCGPKDRHHIGDGYAKSKIPIAFALNHKTGRGGRATTTRGCMVRGAPAPLQCNVFTTWLSVIRSMAYS
jgi:hypothetical protein